MSNLIRRFEGCRLTAYKCPVGKWTIGFGHTEGVKEGDQITEQEAWDILDEDLKVYSLAVDKAVNVDLNPNQFEALTSLCYNIGVKAFSNSTLVKKLNAYDYVGAAMEFPKWSKAGRDRLAGLLRRRAAEMELFLTR
jgi:lysozyme